MVYKSYVTTCNKTILVQPPVIIKSQHGSARWDCLRNAIHQIHQHNASSLSFEDGAVAVVACFNIGLADGLPAFQANHRFFEA